jgi:hypothetical protein
VNLNWLAKVSNLDRWLLALLPGLAAAAVYAVAFMMPDANALRDVRKQVDTARLQAVSADRAQAQRRELDQLKDRIEARRSSSRTGPATAAVGGAPRQWNAPGQRPAAMAALSRLLEAPGITVVSMVKVADAAGKGADVPGVKEWVRQTGATDSGPQPELWKVEMACDYGRMLEVLQALSLLERTIVPLRLSMDPLDLDSPLRLWSVVVAI